MPQNLRMPRTALAALVIGSLLHCSGCGDAPQAGGGKPIGTLEDALAAQYRGTSIRDRVAKVGTGPRALAELVFSAYARFGEDAPRWLALIVAQNLVEKQEALGILDADVAIAAAGRETLTAWLQDSSEGGVFKIRAARLMLEVDEKDDEARRVYRSALLSSDPDDIGEAVIGLTFLGQAGRQFVPELVACALEEPGTMWIHNIVWYFERHGVALPPDLSAKYDAKRLPGGSVEAVIDLGDDR